MTAPRPEQARPEPPDLSPLAEPDAGLLDEDLLDEARAREVRAAAESDPAARAMTAALAATRAELAAVADPSVPPALAARWRAALRAEQARLSTPSSPAQPVGDQLDPTRPSTPTPHGRRSSWGRSSLLRRPAVLAAALLVAVLVGGGLLNARHEQLPSVDRPQLLAQGLSTVGVRDSGGLDDPARRTACLRAVAAPGVTPSAPLLGGRRVVFEGRSGLLLVLGTGRRGSFDIVVVDPACGPDGGTLFASTHVAPP